jgi:trk system potassium uptake protein TrkH
MTSSLGSHPSLSEVTQEALDLHRKRRLPVPLRLLVALAGLIAIGTGLLLLPWMTTQPISFMDALFTATSASAVTGLSVLTTSTAFTRLGQWVLLFLMEAGGLGFMVKLVLTLRLLGRHISLVDRLAVSSSLGLASPKGILQVLGRTVAYMLAVEGVGALILWAHWRLSGIVPAGDAAFYALFHSVAAFCNAGFDLFAGLPQYPAGIPTDPITLLALGWLVIIGGLGIPVYMELLHRRTARKEGARLRRLSLQTRLALWSALALVLIGWVGLLLGEFRQGGVLAGLPLGERVLRAWFQSAATRTAGFAGLGDAKVATVRPGGFRTPGLRESIEACRSRPVPAPLRCMICPTTPAAVSAVPRIASLKNSSMNGTDRAYLPLQVE